MRPHQLKVFRSYDENAGGLFEPEPLETRTGEPLPIDGEGCAARVHQDERLFGEPHEGSILGCLCII